ncbi:expansin B1 [Trifolium repens]|nr:expansin B1 [Trifolium repens]
MDISHQFSLVCFILLFPALCNCKEYYAKSRASYYDTYDGYGNSRGACGFGDYGKIVNDGSVAAVSAKLWKNGEGCGACYQVRCKIPQFCDDNGANVVVTDYGEGDRTDFIMSPRAFSKLGRNEVASEKLKKYGVLDVEYKRVPCTFKGNNIVYKINENSNNPYYFAINILYVGGTYDVTTVEIWQREQHQWVAMRRSYGAVFDFANPPKGEIRLRFQVSKNIKAHHVVSRFAIPATWKAGATYSTKIWHS